MSPNDGNAASPKPEEGLGEPASTAKQLNDGGAAPPQSRPLVVRPLTLIGVAISMVTGMALGVAGYWLWPSTLGDLRLVGIVGESIRHIKAKYVETVAEDQLVDDALRGMLAGLDRHSRYLDPTAFKNLQADMDGAFGGVGVKLRMVDGHCTLIAVTEGAPAQAAGLLPGDQLRAIDGVSLQGERLSAVVRQLRGPVGTEMELDVRRGERGFRLSLVRTKISVDSIAAHWLAPGYAYVRILHFNRATDAEFRDTVRTLAEEAALSGLALDLRGNSGGMLGAAVDVAGTLLDGGLVASTESRSPRGREELLAAAGDLLQGAPVAVLIDEGSASAAEIVAGALKDRGRAAILGERSYGKGTVQSVVMLGRARGIKLTTAYYYTPSGVPIQDRGIEPDIPTAGDQDAVLSAALAWLKNPKHLPAQT